VERAVILANPDEPIDVHHLFRGGEVPGHSVGLDESGRLATPAPPAAPRPPADLDRARYAQVLQDARYNVAEAARVLGLTRPQTAYRLRKLGLL
jgi:transcriptional regulator with GAF, ATPase, and Fis domain